MHTLTSCIEYITKNFISAEIKGQISSETVITGICYDSRKIETDNIFFCKGRNFSTEYLQEAVFKGAACIVCPRKFSFVTKLYNENTVFVLTDKVREVMAHFSAFFYGFPLFL